MNRKLSRFFLLFLTLFLAACGGDAEVSEPAAEVADVATDTPTVVVEPTTPREPTATTAPVEPTEAAAVEEPATEAPPPTDAPTAEPTATAEPELALVFGRTEEGAYFYGAEDAPVTVIDYSDFL